MLRFLLLLFFPISFFSVAHAFEWHRGLYQIDHIDPGVQFAKYGEVASEMPDGDFPLEFSKLAEFSATSSANFFFRASTGILGKWEGPGKISIEAFDHSWLGAGLSDELTRTILYFNKGLLFINAETLNNGSSIIVETPLGKVTALGGIFSIKLEDFKGDTRRNAMIYCYKGSLEYTDQNGVLHALSNGNKMPIILKDDLFKVNTVVMDELETRALDNFNKERVNFIEPDAFPKFENPPLVDLTQSDESLKEDENFKKYYYFPVLKEIKPFNPYKKSYFNSED